MDIERLKHQHVGILTGVATMRRLSHAGIVENAAKLAEELKSLGGTITTHLAIEDRVLYPSLFKHGNQKIVDMAHAYQSEMQGITNAFVDFSRRWSSADEITRDPEGFRDHANTALKALHIRMQKENKEFYPTIEALQIPLGAHNTPT